MGAKVTISSVAKATGRSISTVYSRRNFASRPAPRLRGRS